METLSVKAFAKLNLTLDVTGVLPGGYHSVRTVMQSVALCDDITLTLKDTGGLSVSTDLYYLPRDDRNLAVRAAKLFFAETGTAPGGLRIVIKKRIPVGAGLGGGSSDAAAVLRGLDELTGAGLGRARLETISAALGSDVPFCVAGGTALVEGRGERLTPLPPMPFCHIVICKPGFPISTPELFGLIDSAKLRCRPDSEGLIDACAAGSLPEVAIRLYNVFEDVLPRKYGEVADIKSRLLDLGALGVTMSGTGSAVFGLFANREPAENAFERLRGRWRDCFLTAPVGAAELPY